MSSRRRRQLRNQRITTSVPINACSEEEDDFDEEDCFTDTEEEDEVVMPPPRRATRAGAQAAPSSSSSSSAAAAAAATAHPKKHHSPPKAAPAIVSPRSVAPPPAIHITPLPQTPYTPKPRAPVVMKPFEDPDNIRLEWEHPDIEYNENEDLLNFRIPQRPQELRANEKGYRLMVSKIKVDNFKSYRGEHTLGPFHKNLTMILGPNGSGKSNVIDALLFVFGFRSNKIRTKKLSSLIHTAASLGGKRCDYCRVEITMYFVKDMNQDDYIVKKNSTFSVSRTVFLDNTSKYTIDGRTSSHKEVESYFERVGIDLVHNRFLILQGEVEAIAMMKPRATAPGEEGMLEYIEDIVGSNRFVPFIRKLEHRVRQLEIQSSQQSLYVREAEKSKKEMEPDVRHAQRFINAQNEATLLRSRLWQIERYQHIESKKPIEVEIGDREQEICDAEERKRSLIMQIREIEASERENAVKIATVQDEIDLCIQNIRDAELAEFKRKSNLKKGNLELVRLMTECEALDKQIVELKGVPDTAKNRIEMLQGESAALKEEADKYTKTATANTPKFDKKAKDEQVRREAAEEEWSRKNAVLNELRTRATVMESDMVDMVKSSARDQKALDEQKRQLEQLKQKYDNDLDELAEIPKELAEPEIRWRDASNKLPSLQAKKAQLTAHKNHLEATSKEENCDFDETFKGKAAHGALLKAKATGKLPNFLGRLGDLASIDAKYDVAISTIMPQLDWYVVETVDDGQVAINFLNEKKLNRSSFMCLDKNLKPGLKITSGARLPATRLFDRVVCDDKRIRLVYYQYLNDLLVVDTVEQAQTIDTKYNGKYRVVTLDGTTIDKTGSVSGGGKPITGKMNLGTKTDEKAALLKRQQAAYFKTKHELEQTTKEYERVSEELAQVERDITEYSKIVNDLCSRRFEINSTLQDDLENINAKKKVIETLKLRVEQMTSSPEELKRREAELEKIKKERDDAEVIANNAKAKVDKSTAKIDAMYTELVAKWNEKSNLALTRRESVEQEIAKERASIVNSQHNLVEAQQQRANKDHELMKKRIEIDALSSAEQENKEDATFGPLLENRKTQLQNLREHEQEFRKQRNQLEVEEREVAARIANLCDIVNALQQQVDNYEFKLETLDRNLKLLRIEKVPDFRNFENLQVKTKVGWICYDENGEEEKDSSSDDDDDDDNDNNGRNAARRNVRDLFDDVVEVTTLSDQQIKEMTRDEKDKMVNELKTLEKFMETNRQNTDVSIFEEYLVKARLYATHVAKMEEYGNRLTVHRKKLHELRTMRHTEFADALAFLGATTQDLYQMITNGGNASLKFVEEGRSDPFDAGVKFSVRPAKKSWKLIENLSGGEKTLASLCFVFAMHHYRATPLYVMDEIDAALDTQNVLLIANYIKNSERTRNAQFIIISLRNQMFEVANRLIGVSKTDDCTHHVVLNPPGIKFATNSTNKNLKKIARERQRVTVVEEEMPAATDEQSTSTMIRSLRNIHINNGNEVRRTTEKKKQKVRVLHAPRIEDLEPDPVRPRVLLMKKAQDLAVALHCEDLNFDEDDAPVIKRRRRKCAKDGEVDEEEDIVKEPEDDCESENNDATTSAAEALIDFSSAPSTSTATPSTSRRAARTTCRKREGSSF